MRLEEALTEISRGLECAPGEIQAALERFLGMIPLGAPKKSLPQEKMAPREKSYSVQTRFECLSDPYPTYQLMAQSTSDLEFLKVRTTTIAPQGRSEGWRICVRKMKRDKMAPAWGPRRGGPQTKSV